MTAVLEREIVFDSTLVTVSAVRDVSPHLRRITFRGDRLAEVVAAGPDQRIKLFLAPPAGGPIVLPTGDWYQSWLAMPEEQRVVMRTYTIRALRPDRAELDVDFAMHGRLGPASSWAYDVAPGNEVGLLLPFAVDTSCAKGMLMSGVDYVPPATSTHRLLIGDETALPAVECILEQLPAGVGATVFLEVQDASDIRPIGAAAKADLTWVVGEPVLDALRRAILPEDLDYVWVAGESGMIKQVRRHLVAAGMPKRSISFQGYWKRGEAQC